MRIPTGIFIQFSMLIIIGILWFYQKADRYFIVHDGSQQQIQKLKEEVESKNFQIKVAQLENQEVKTQTLSLLENENLLPKTSLARNHLESGLRSPASVKKLDFTLLRVEELRSLFREKKYSQVIFLGEKLLNKDKTFIVKPEVLFFLSEAYYLTNQYENSINTINQMVSLYPEHIMTGYALLRLAKISEQSEQYNEAGALYRIVSTQFKDKTLTIEAKRLLAKLNE
ncbi:MAG: hypothetical protein KDD45_17505 [Bdellovibrionales bacterium]|nr:hypothetical protein [Bdellovibrionales bacterium]